MSGLFGTLSVANKGLMAQQTSLHTTGHNVSNANTEGYTRQRVNLQADMAYNFVGVGQLGTGVRMTSIIRMSNEYVNRQIWNEASNLERYDVKSEIMGQLEGIFNEPSDTGINSDLNQVFDAWAELAKNPESLTAKTVVSEKMKALSDNINHMYKQMDSLKTETESQLSQGVKDFNSTIEKLDQLNEQIFFVAIRGQSPNDLLDQRDMLIEDLNRNIDVDIKFDEYGRTKVNIKGEELADFMVLDYTRQNSEMTIDLEDGVKVGLKEVDQKEAKEIDITDKINSGSFKGNFEGVEQIEKTMEGLKDFAQGISSVFNKIHGKDSDLTNLFEETVDEDNGIIIKLNEDIYEDPGKISAGFKSDSPVGDGSRAAAIGKLRSAKFSLDNLEDIVKEEDETIIINVDPNGNTVEGHYADIITGLGIAKQQADDMVDNQELLLHQLQMRKESESGVSINEEVTDMIRFQSAYQANARVIQTISDMLDTLINRTGV